MKSKLTCVIPLTAVLTLAGCSGMPFLRATPSCQVAPPDSSLTQPCPKEISGEIPAFQGQYLLPSHQQSRESYDVCATYHASLIKWVNDVMARCVAKK